MSDLRRQVPRTDALLADPRLVAAAGRRGRDLVKAAGQGGQQRVRDGRLDPDDAADAVLAALEKSGPCLLPDLYDTIFHEHNKLWL